MYHPLPFQDALVVCDQARLRTETIQVLRDVGLLALDAANVPQAMIRLEETRVAVLLIDVACLSEMPDFRRLRSAANGNCQIILLADESETQRAADGIRAGADGMLPKPINNQALLAQLEYSSNRYRSLAIAAENEVALEADLVAQTNELRQMHSEVMQLLSVASCYRDHETGTHNQRVGMVSALLARAVGWSESAAQELQLAALMHDIGKLAIPDAILRKPGKLSDEEYRIMQAHTVIGDEMLASSRLPVLGLSRQIALCHHERWDGDGYPHGIAKDKIPESARIVAIADVHDALTHDRVYRPALPEAKALQIIGEGRESHFDPQLLDAFFDIREEVKQINETVIETSAESQLKNVLWGLPSEVQAI